MYFQPEEDDPGQERDIHVYVEDISQDGTGCEDESPEGMSDVIYDETNKEVQTEPYP